MWLCQDNLADAEEKEPTEWDAKRPAAKDEALPALEEAALEKEEVVEEKLEAAEVRICKPRRNQGCLFGNRLLLHRHVQE